MLSIRRFKTLRPIDLIRLGVTALSVLASASATLAGVGLTTGAAKLFDGPVAGAEVVATIPAGSKVGILWCGMQMKWCLVSFHDKQGFVGFTSLLPAGGRAAGGDPGAHGGPSGGVPAAIASGIYPPISVVTGPGMAYVGGDSKTLFTKIRH